MDQIGIDESWRASFNAHQNRRGAEPAATPRAVVPDLVPHTELSSHRLVDLLELSEFANVAWPPGLDARIARQILSARGALSTW